MKINQSQKARCPASRARTSFFTKSFNPTRLSSLQPTKVLKWCVPPRGAYSCETIRRVVSTLASWCNTAGIRAWLWPACFKAKTNLHWSRSYIFCLVNLLSQISAKTQSHRRSNRESRSEYQTCVGAVNQNACCHLHVQICFCASVLRSSGLLLQHLTTIIEHSRCLLWK